MNDKLNELKAKQEEISNKITSLQVTNKKKDEETVEIRKLIAECRENLNRIKGLGPGSEVLLEPCSEMEGLNIDPKEGDDKKNEAGIHTSEPINKRPNPVNDVKPLNDVNTVNPVLVPIDKKRCADLLGKKECKAPDTKKKGKCKVSRRQ